MTDRRVSSRGPFIEKKQECDSFHKSSFSRVKKRGIRMKMMSLGNWLMGCRIDSSERSFGRTFVSNELLVAVIYKHNREFGVVTNLCWAGKSISTHLCDRHATVMIHSSHPMSISSLSCRVLWLWTTRT